jgi:hypothetical protein
MVKFCKHVLIKAPFNSKTLNGKKILEIAKGGLRALGLMVQQSDIIMEFHDIKSGFGRALEGGND